MAYYIIEQGKCDLIDFEVAKEKGKGTPNIDEGVLYQNQVSQYKDRMRQEFNEIVDSMKNVGIETCFTGDDKYALGQIGINTDGKELDIEDYPVVLYCPPGASTSFGDIPINC
ncbi:MAG: hypothetical protein AAFN65_03665 [Bacteroidota bacterium]